MNAECRVWNAEFRNSAFHTLHSAIDHEGRAMLVGQRVGPFDIERELGCGAMGSVYLARYRKNGTKVAIKVMAQGLGGNTTAQARFEREADMLKQLNHPNIVRFYVASHFQGSPYYAMEYIEGEGLDKVLERRGRFHLGRDGGNRPADLCRVTACPRSRHHSPRPQAV
jgi:serine/threonine protein kinase